MNAPETDSPIRLALAAGVAALALAIIATAPAPPVYRVGVVLLEKKPRAPLSAGTGASQIRAALDDPAFLSAVDRRLSAVVRDALIPAPLFAHLRRAPPVPEEVSPDVRSAQHLRSALSIDDRAGVLEIVVRARGRGIAAAVAHAVAAAIREKIAVPSEDSATALAGLTIPPEGSGSAAMVSAEAIASARAELASASRVLAEALERPDAGRNSDAESMNAARAVAEQERRIASLLLTLGERHPDVVAAREKLAGLERARDRLRRNHDENAAAALKAARAQEGAARARIARLESARTLPAPAPPPPRPAPRAAPWTVLVLHDPSARPINPRPERSLPIAAGLGFVGGLALAALRGRAG